MIAVDPQEEFKRDYAIVHRKLRKELSRLQRQYTHRSDALAQALDWHSAHHEGQLLQSNLFRIKPRMTSIDVVDWELPEGSPARILVLEARTSPAGQVERLFKKSKKLRAAVPHAKRLLEQTEGEVIRLLEELQQLEACDSAVGLKIFCEKHQIFPQEKSAVVAKKELKAPKLPYKAFTSATGMLIWAGKSARDNDALTFHHAKGSDWWLHAHNHAGSHVVIRVGKGEEPDEATLKDAAEIALRMSQGKNAHSGDVAVTQVKWLRKVKGAPGKVMLSEHRVMHHDLDNARWNRLRNN
jgi:predicted ribosome quality control (RQC) complex YloA/Tae2 family protein